MAISNDNTPMTAADFLKMLDRSEDSRDIALIELGISASQLAAEGKLTPTALLHYHLDADEREGLPTDRSALDQILIHIRQR
ncbi:hypothetical protein [Corynebacterium dentalis]|uniref:hypothetical protein n=1 Tax=Corynebacterium dentalis TaxID=2014528 RepID=UPI000C06D234|nr:hypothetical protein [Corynebacterium dentalis]